MSDIKPEQLIEEALNQILDNMNHVEDERREVERQATRISEKMTELDSEARRLRLALFALEGKPLDNAEANKVNTHMRREIRRANP